MKKLGERINHPKLGRGEIVGTHGRGSAFRYVARFRRGDGSWVSAFLTHAEACYRSPPKKRRSKAGRKPKTIPADATDHEIRLMLSLGLTLEQVREATK